MEPIEPINRRFYDAFPRTLQVMESSQVTEIAKLLFIHYCLEHLFQSNRRSRPGFRKLFHVRWGQLESSRHSNFVTSIDIRGTNHCTPMSYVFENFQVLTTVQSCPKGIEVPAIRLCIRTIQ